jgi:hypothetical protein
LVEPRNWRDNRARTGGDHELVVAELGAASFRQSHPASSWAHNPPAAPTKGCTGADHTGSVARVIPTFAGPVPSRHGGGKRFPRVVERERLRDGAVKMSPACQPSHERRAQECLGRHARDERALTTDPSGFDYCDRAFRQLRPDPLACRSRSKHDHVKVPHARTPVRTATLNGTIQLAPSAVFGGPQMPDVVTSLWLPLPMALDGALLFILRQAEGCAAPVVVVREW